MCDPAFPEMVQMLVLRHSGSCTKLGRLKSFRFHRSPQARNGVFRLDSALSDWLQPLIPSEKAVKGDMFKVWEID
jgi:hypothetical protein